MDAEIKAPTVKNLELSKVLSPKASALRSLEDSNVCFPFLVHSKVILSFLVPVYIVPAYIVTNTLLPMRKSVPRSNRQLDHTKT